MSGPRDPRTGSGPHAGHDHLQPFVERIRTFIHPRRNEIDRCVNGSDDGRVHPLLFMERVTDDVVHESVCSDPS